MPEFVRVDQFGGVGLFYDRSSPNDYGVRGVPMRPLVDEGFARQTEQAMTALFGELEAADIGTVKAIFCGGISRDPSSGGRSLHHRNRAFDLDGLVFESTSKWIATSFPEKPHLYLGIEAVLRKFFGTVLAYSYNAAHHDHIHFDNGTSVGFESMAKSRVEFVQNCAKFLFDRDIDADGVFGPETRRVVDAIRREHNLGSLSEKSSWLAFLNICTDVALARAVRQLTV